MTTAEVVEPWNEDRPGDAERNRAMAAEMEAIHERNNRGDFYGSEHEVKAMWNLKRLVDSGHAGRLSQIIAYAEQHLTDGKAVA